MNLREKIKKARLTELGTRISEAKKNGETIDKKKLISMLIVRYGISKRTAMEELDAVMNYDYDEK
jgi:hypothetical protein